MAAFRRDHQADTRDCDLGHLAGFPVRAVIRAGLEYSSVIVTEKLAGAPRVEAQTTAGRSAMGTP